MKIEQIAKVCHQANKAYCEAVGDFSQTGWEVAEGWQKASVVEGVKHYLANPKTTPEQSHISWLKLRVKEGWTYDVVKDPSRLVHPCIVPYAELPVAQRAKDELLLAVCSALASQLDVEELPEPPVVEVHPDAAALAMDAQKPVRRQVRSHD